MKTRVATLTLALLLALCGLLTACSAGEDPAVTDTPGSTEAATEAATDSPYEALDKENYDREFVILVRTDCAEDFDVSSLTGDVLDDAIYERNVTVGNDYGVEFVFHSQGNTYTTVNEKVQQQVSGGLDDYDLYTGHKYSFTNLAVNNYLYNLGAISTMDLTQPWWDQGCYENLTLEGKSYVMTGDILPSSSMRISSCFTVNKDMMNELQKDMNALNDLTLEGGWTLDVLLSHSEDVTADLNGDGAIRYADDRYCLTGWMMAAPYAMFYGAGGMFVEIVEGTPELTFSNEDVTNIYEKIFNAVVGADSYYVTDESLYDTMFDVFTEGRALFSCMTLHKITEYLLEMEDAYGILPVPKYDTYQPEYLSFVNGSTSLVMVAKNESDTEFVGAILEAMAAYNYEHVTPLMFQVVTKLQAAQDPVSATMVDLIIHNRVFDMGYFADFTVTNLVKENLGHGRAEIASALTSQRRAAERSLRLLLEDIDACD